MVDITKLLTSKNPCQCNLCKLGRDIEKVKKNRNPDELIKLLDIIADLYLNASSDSDYYYAILHGDWPTAEQKLAHALKLARNKNNSQTKEERYINDLIDKWEIDTKYKSNIDTEHSSFKYILNMKGHEKIVTYILRRINLHPSWIVTVLFKLVPEKEHPCYIPGKIESIIDAWIKWGEERKLINQPPVQNT